MEHETPNDVKKWNKLVREALDGIDEDGKPIDMSEREQYVIDLYKSWWGK